MRKIFLFIFIILILKIIGYSQNENTPQEKILNYKIKAGDTLEISVYGEPDMTKTVKVSEDGTIIYPFIGEVKIAGLTIKEAIYKIKLLLQEGYFVNPQVNIFLQEYSKFFIIGAVNQEGRFELKGNLTLLDAIALAGGAKENANLTKIKVIRKIGNEEREFIIDLDTQGKDFFLEPLDRIIVEEYGKISVLGALNSPGSFSLKKNTSLIDAIALAGGAKENANLTKIKITREEAGQNKEYIVDLEKEGDKFLLQEKDVVFVFPYKQISVLGQVNKPGNYNFKPNMTVVDAIAMAGGFSSLANQNQVTVIRETEGKKKIFNVPVGSILKSGDRSKDIPLCEGDIITVAESIF